MRAIENAEDWPAIERQASLTTHDSLLRADFIYNKGIEKFGNSALYGNYAKYKKNIIYLL